MVKEYSDNMEQIVDILKQLEPDTIEVDGDIVYGIWTEQVDELKTEVHIHFHINSNEVTSMTQVIGTEEQVDICSIDLNEMRSLLKLSRRVLKTRYKKIVSIKRSLLKLVDRLESEGCTQPENLLNAMLFDNSLTYYSQ
jgi:hypothetical protein